MNTDAERGVFCPRGQMESYRTRRNIMDEAVAVERIEIDDATSGKVWGGMPIGTGVVQSGSGDVFYCEVCKKYIGLTAGVTKESHNQSHNR